MNEWNGVPLALRTRISVLSPWKTLVPVKYCVISSYYYHLCEKQITLMKCDISEVYLSSCFCLCVICPDRLHSGSDFKVCENERGQRPQSTLLPVLLLMCLIRCRTHLQSWLPGAEWQHDHSLADRCAAPLADSPKTPGEQSPSLCPPGYRREKQVK